MKKIYLALALIIGTMAVSFGQTKSSGTVQLNGTALTLKVDVDNTHNLVTFTMTGPLNQWFAIGLNLYTMGNSGTDCITYGTQLLDQHFTGGHNQPATDATNNLTLVSAVNGTSTRTIVFTRPLSTGDANDYTFNYSTLSSLNIVWAVGPNNNVAYQHNYYSSTTLSFATLGSEDFVSPLERTTVYPNPSNGIFKVAKSADAELTTIKVFDINAKLLKEINPELESEIQVDMTGVSKGIYFLELSNGSDKAVKKIQLN